MTVGQKLSTLRKKEGISQELLAEQTRISLRTIQRIENDESVPRFFTLKMLAEHFGIEPSALSSDNPEDAAFPALQDNNLMRLLNSSALLVIILPIIHIGVQLAIWYRSNPDPMMKAMGKRIIGFQILWVACCIVALLLTHFTYYYLTGSFMIGKISPLVYTYGIMLLINIGVVITAAFRLKVEHFSIYSAMPLLF